MTERDSGGGGEVFARIARRYDRVNRLLSFGRDDDWRRRAIEHLPPGTVLDLGAGTGAANPDLGDRTVVALDPAPQMLALNPARRRIVGKGEALPFADGSVLIPEPLQGHMGTDRVGP